MTGMIQSRRFLLAGLLQGMMLNTVWAQPVHAVNYLEAVRLALQCNPRIGASQAQIESARAAIMETRGAGLPKLNLDMNAARSDNPLNVFSYKLSQGNVSFADFGLGQYTGPGSLNTLPQALNSPGYYSNYNAGFKLLIPIYAGGEHIAKRKSADSLLQAAQQGDQAARMQLAYDVLQAYEAVLASRKLVLIAQDAVSAAIEYSKTTRGLYQQSLVIDSDKLLADTWLRSANLALISAKAEWQNHLDEFRSLVGQPTALLTPGETTRFPETRLPLSSLTCKALANNARLRALQSTIRASRANVEAVNANSRPQVNLQLRQDWNGNAAGAGLSSNLVALGMNWELFSSGEQSGAVKKARAEVKQATFQRDDVANTIRLSIKQARRAEKLASLQYQVSKENARQARSVVHRLASRYGRGLVPLGQLLESQMRLNEAKNQCVQSQYNRVLARGRLLMLTNELIPSFEK